MSRRERSDAPAELDHDDVQGGAGDSFAPRPTRILLACSPSRGALADATARYARARSCSPRDGLLEKPPRDTHLGERGGAGKKGIRGGRRYHQKNATHADCPAR